jgi:hypothetical protein
VKIPEPWNHVVFWYSAKVGLGFAGSFGAKLPRSPSASIASICFWKAGRSHIQEALYCLELTLG